MGEVNTIGLEIAKSVFQVHGVDDTGTVVIRKRISRAKVLEFFGNLSSCLVGIEACPSAHHWSIGFPRSIPMLSLDRANYCCFESRTHDNRVKALLLN